MLPLRLKNIDNSNRTVGMLGLVMITLVMHEVHIQLRQLYTCMMSLLCNYLNCELNSWANRLIPAYNYLVTVNEVLRQKLMFQKLLL